MSLLLHLERALEEITGILIEMIRMQMENVINILTSIKGIGSKTVVNFLIEMGDDVLSMKRSGKSLPGRIGSGCLTIR